MELWIKIIVCFVLIILLIATSWISYVMPFDIKKDIKISKQRYKENSTNENKRGLISSHLQWLIEIYFISMSCLLFYLISMLITKGAK